MKKQSLILIGLLMAFQCINAQGSPDYTGGLKVKLNGDQKLILIMVSKKLSNGIRVIRNNFINL